jgi:hypothetical protein
MKTIRALAQAAFYRRMLSALPREAAENIAYRNGMALFGLK